MADANARDKQQFLVVYIIQCKRRCVFTFDNEQERMEHFA